MKTKPQLDAQLPSMPAVAMRLIETLSDPDFALPEVIDAVRTDPSLTAKILRVANSPMFAGRAHIDDVEKAVVWLGRQAVACVSLSFSLNKIVRENEGSARYYRDYWLQSVIQATAMDTLAAELGFGRQGAAFTAGLLMDIGRLSLLQTRADEYTALIDQANEQHRSFHELEREAFGTTHCDVSAQMLRHWGLPEDMAKVALHHHDEAAAFEEIDSTSKVVLIAGAIAASAGEYFCGPNRGRGLARMQTLCQLHDAFDDLVLEDFFDQVRQEMTHTSQVFDIKAEDIPAPSIMLGCAVEQLRLLAKRTRARCNEMMRQTPFALADNEPLRRHVAELENRSCRIDGTGLYSSDYLHARFRQRMAQSQEVGERTGVVMIVVDQEHDEEVHRQVGRYLADHCHGDCIAAETTDEGFAVVCQPNSLDELESFANSIKASVETALRTAGTTDSEWTASVGAVYAMPRSSGELDSAGALEVGTSAVSQAKRQGGNVIVLRTIGGPDIDPPTRRLHATPASALN